MKVCILTEGSYPYVLGGVSSWIHTFIMNNKQHEFILYTICSGSKSENTYKYTLPDNVIEIKEVFLNDIDINKCANGKDLNLKQQDIDSLKILLSNNDVDWNSIFKFFKENKFKNIGDFLMSKDFFDIAKSTYEEKYKYTPFTEFLWNIRSMYVTLFYLLMQDIPKADIYHSLCTGYSGVLASYARYLYESKFVLSEHGIYTREREEEIIKSNWIKSYHKELWIDFFKKISLCAYEHSDIVTSLFKANKDSQVGLGCDEEKIQIIPNGIDIKKYKNLDEKKDKNIINIGAIVRVVPIKDIKTMLLSFKLVKEEIPNAMFYIMGPQDENKEYYEECLELIKEFDIKDVILTGTVNILDYIGKMDIMVLTSISEGQPLSVLEGMAAKKPHVCTNVGHCKGLLEGDGDPFGKCGFVEDVTDYNGIANSIIRLSKDEILRASMGNNGYERIKNLYQIEDTFSMYEEIYSIDGEDIQWQELALN